MENKNYIYMAITAILIVIFIAMYIIFGDNKFWKTEEFDKTVDEYNERIELKNLEESEMEAAVNEILKDTPGIACWGDGFTYGTYGSGESYPATLEELVKKDGYPYEVVNMGVYGEDSRTVLGRVGALPFVVSESFVIDGSGELIEIAIESEDGSEVNPCIQDYNPGFNPCVVNGVNCTIYGAVTPDALTKASAYYLSRQDYSTKTVEVEAGTVVETSGSTGYDGYINILLIGDGGGYSSDTELMEQTQRFVEKYGEEGKYIVIGRLSGNEESNRVYDDEMEERFGNNYLNAREILSSEEISGVSYSDSDREEMSEGKIPECLTSNGYLNNKGYEALGNIVFERLKELDIMEKVTSR